nr:MmoB/DmpM family protein [Thauera sp. 63]
MKEVYIALQAIEEALPIIDAIMEDNPDATLRRYPAMVRIEAPGRLTVKRATVSAKIGRDWDPQELHVCMISIGGNVYETDDEFSLQWGATK